MGTGKKVRCRQLASIAKQRRCWLQTSPCDVRARFAWGVEECTVGQKRVHGKLRAYDTKRDLGVSYGEVHWRAKGSTPEVCGDVGEGRRRVCVCVNGSTSVLAGRWCVIYLTRNYTVRTRSSLNSIFTVPFPAPPSYRVAVHRKYTGRLTVLLYL